MKTIDEAKKYLRDNFETGVKCPCCGQMVRKWRYCLTSSVALCLIEMYKLHINGKEWVHVNTEIRPQSGGFFSLLKWWKLIEIKPKEGEDKRVSGYWRLTKSGEQFVLGNITVPKYVETYDNKLIGFSGDPVNIKQVLGKKFSYEELMTS